MPRRIDGGAVAAALGAVVLLVSIFLDWFEPDLSAWTVFETLDMVLAAISLAALAIVVPRLIGTGRPLLPDGLLPVLGVSAFVIVGVQLINHPPAAIGRGEEIGAWLALGGALLLLVGATLWIARISFSVTVREREPAPRREAPAAAPPAEPAPPPEPPPSGETATRRIPDDQSP